MKQVGGNICLVQNPVYLKWPVRACCQRRMWRFCRKLAKRLIGGLLQLADADKEIYDHGSLMQVIWFIFPPYTSGFQIHSMMSLDDLVKEMGISRRNIKKNHMRQRQICLLQSLIGNWDSTTLVQGKFCRKALWERNLDQTAVGSLYSCTNKEGAILNNLDSSGIQED